MTRFGSYDAVSLLHRDGRASVWSARSAAVAGGRPDQILKRVDLTPDDLAADDARPANHLLAAAALQQAMADRCPHWAPVRGLGTAGGSTAYAVLDLYPRSAQHLIDGRRRLTSDGLRIVLLAVVDALIELQVAYARPHGNLKPSNVLIGRRLRPGTVFVTDPAASGEHVGSLDRAPDPRASGRLLYALVTRRHHTTARWPLKYDAPWAALGASGPEWFSVAGSLLHPRCPEHVDWDELMTRLVAIRPTRRRVPRLALAVPAVLAVVAAGYAGRAPLGRWCGIAGDQIRTTALAFYPTPKKKPAKGSPVPRKPRVDFTAAVPKASPVAPPAAGRPATLSDDLDRTPVSLPAHADRPHPGRP